MAKITTKWIEDGAVDESKFKSTNDAYVTGRNNADDGDVDAYKINASDAIEFATIPVMPSTAPTTDGSVSNKKYVDDQIAALPAVPALFEVKGNWNGTTNSPTLANTDTSVDLFLYYVSVAGSVDFGAGSITFAIGDWVYNVNGAWEKADNNDDVLSVNSQVGVVVLDADDVSDSATTNKYTTAAEISKLAGIETSATADQTGAEIKVAYEAEANTNAYTDTEKSKLGGISAGAEVNRTLDAVPTNGNTANSVSSDGVFDALALKAVDADVIKKDGSVAYTSAQSMGSSKITSLADGTVNSDAVNKGQMDTAIAAASGSTQGRQVITLTGTDISNGYVELAQPILASSLHVTPVGGLSQEPTADFTESIVVTNTRVTFAGDLASTLASGDKLIMNYEY